MSLPRLLRIGGHLLKVKVYDLLKEDASTDMGYHRPAMNTIGISSTIVESQQWATLLHEILEAINFSYAVKLEHEQIMQLESALFQVLEENFPLWREGR